MSSNERIYKCSVSNCKNNTSNNDCTLHRLPVIAHVRDEWIQRCNLTKIGENTFVCSRHFTSDDYLPTLREGLRKRLKKIAVPSLLLTGEKKKHIPNILRNVSKNNSVPVKSSAS